MYRPHCARSVLPRTRANIPQYGPRAWLEKKLIFVPGDILDVPCSSEFSSSFAPNGGEIVYLICIHWIIFLVRDGSRRITWSNVRQLKLGNIRGYTQEKFHNFQTFLVRSKKFVWDSIQDERAFGYCFRRRHIFVCSHSPTREHSKVYILRETVNCS